MFTLLLALLASADLGHAQADNKQYHPHAAFAFIRSGERTPVLRGPQTLTALGAQQMLTLGQNFRARYISPDGDAGLGRQRIANMSVDVLDNTQISVQTLNSPYLVSAAQAFMQGLYPPHSASNSSGDGGNTGSLADGTTVDYPLNGYQYAMVQTYDQDAYQSMYLTAEHCPMSKVASLNYLTTPDFVTTSVDSDSVYEKLDVDWFEGHLKSDQLNYMYALEIYDYLSYQYTHDQTVRDKLTNDEAYAGVYNLTRDFADEYAWNFWGNTAASPENEDRQAIAGKTLAAEILGTFQKLVTNKTTVNEDTDGPADRTSDDDDGAMDDSYPLTLLFGETGSFVSMASLMLMDQRDAHFHSAAAYASAMVFELYSVGIDDGFPTNAEDLWVRFYFHNGSEPFHQQLMSYPMFNNGPSKTDMAWSEFQDQLSKVMVNSVGDWCDACASASVFCRGVEKSNITYMPPSQEQRARQHKTLSASVAGAIGAVVSLAVASLIFGIAMLVGGVRFHRVQRSNTSGLGGFKGSAKLASDADLGFKNNEASRAGVVVGGKGHERSGSWELRQKEYGVQSGDMGEAFPRDSVDEIEGARAVQPHERV